MKCFKIVIPLIVVLLAGSCREDTIQPTLFGSMVGTVIRDADNVAVNNAIISTTPPTSLILTDEFGRFALNDIEPGTYTIRAEKEGFAPEVESITVFEEKTANVIIKLSPDTLSNVAPSAPSNPSPADNSVEQEVEFTLGWTATDSDRNDELRYDILLCTGNQTNCEVIAMDVAIDTFRVRNLRHNTVYFWQVIAKDKATEVASNIWSFQTKPFPNNRFVYTKFDGQRYDIFSADADGNEIQLTFGPGSNYRPRISPDRQKIAFIGNSGIEPHLFVMDRDGQNLRQVTRDVPIDGFNNFDLDFAWSPGSNQLLYMNNAMLYTINVDGTALRTTAQAPEGFTFSEVDWMFSNEGNRILARVTGNTIYESDIFILDLEGNYLRQIFTDIPGGTGGLQFSIDGKFALYTHDVSEFENAAGRKLDSRIFVKNLENNVTFDLSNLDFRGKDPGTNDLDPRFSPDGAKIIFVNTNNDGISVSNIMTMDIDGKNRTVLFEGAEMPDWR
ncbi:MAG: carboxypeptidase regulatory-like domain-containing protein [Bacteroidota bacterium]